MDHDSAAAYGLWSLVIINSLVFMQVQLARREQRDARAQLGDGYTRYDANTPAFFPGFGVKVHA